MIRGATTDDLESLVSLNEEVQRLHVRIEPTLFRSDFDAVEVAAFFKGVLSDPNSTVLLAEQGSMLGYIWTEHQRRPATPFSPKRERVYLHHISVAEAARRKGVGSALLKAAEREAAQVGVSRIVLEAWASNHSAVEFFTEAGYSAFNLVMARNL